MRQVTPTKSNLTALTEELQLAKEGHTLLEQKREVLIMNLTNIVGEIKEKREELDKQLSESFKLVNLVRLESGTVGLDLLCNSVNEDYSVEVIDHTVMGVVAPKLFFSERKTKSKPSVPIGISGTSPNFDRLYQKSKSMRPLMAEVAYLESTAWKLIVEIDKTQRRINALENFMIPDTTEVIKFIKDTLEEKDRETMFRIKRIKENKLKKLKKLQKETQNDV